jgi:hypothetical protein
MRDSKSAATKLGFDPRPEAGNAPHGAGEADGRDAKADQAKGDRADEVA